jgi:predicted dithiol-disulfide oxidoreductase (DUF899 family)
VTRLSISASAGRREGGPTVMEDEMDTPRVVSPQDWLAARKELLGTYRYLDLTPLGRQRHVTEFPHHDAYATKP